MLSNQSHRHTRKEENRVLPTGQMALWIQLQLPTMFHHVINVLLIHAKFDSEDFHRINVAWKVDAFQHGRAHYFQRHFHSGCDVKLVTCWRCKNCAENRLLVHVVQHQPSAKGSSSRIPAGKIGLAVCNWTDNACNRHVEAENNIAYHYRTKICHMSPTDMGLDKVSSHGRMLPVRR